jgi:hypothetical protein
VAPEDGYRLVEATGERRAVFCRLEHVVPWAIQGAHWEPVSSDEDADMLAEVAVCSQCGAELGDTAAVLVRHRAGHRIPDGFCSVDHLLAWAKAGGRWQ